MVNGENLKKLLAQKYLIAIERTRLFSMNDSLGKAIITKCH